MTRLFLVLDVVKKKSPLKESDLYMFFSARGIFLTGATYTLKRLIAKKYRKQPEIPDSTTVSNSFVNIFLFKLNKSEILKRRM